MPRSSLVKISNGISLTHRSTQVIILDKFVMEKGTELANVSGPMAQHITVIGSRACDTEMVRSRLATESHTRASGLMI